MKDEFTKVMQFLEKLDASKISYELDKIRGDSILIEVAVPDERWEVEFFISGEVEIEIYSRKGEIMDESAFKTLFEEHSD